VERGETAFETRFNPCASWGWETITFMDTTSSRNDWSKWIQYSYILHQMKDDS
jgi:hypothetical protein